MDTPPFAPPALPRATWRLLMSPAADGPTNMAVDEAILLAVAEGAAAPTLRFFAWSPPCLSLGYAQPVAEVDLDRLHRHAWDLVRRPTGGRAILHTDELTYSIIAPLDEPRVRGGVVESYHILSAGLLRGLGRMGMPARAERVYAAAGAGSSPATQGPVCFEVPSDYEITVARDGPPRKLLGSAQVRKQGVVLQHGTLPLTGDLARICEVLVMASEPEREAARQRVRRRAATVADTLGREVTWDEAARALAAGCAEALQLDLVESPLSPYEAGLAARLRAEKYAAAAWTQRA